MKQRSLPLLIAAAVLLAACATTKPEQKEKPKAEDKVEKPGILKPPAAPPTDVSEVSLRTGAFALRADLKNVPFDFDSAKLSEEALAILKANAAILKGDASLEALVAGHCDERGTVAYNLALGQKRAKEVRDYYIRLGVDGARLATISFGKEQPLCAESTEECWAKNRRAETRVRVKGAKAEAAAQPQ